MELAEHYVRFCIQYIMDNNRDDLEYFEAEQFRRAKEEKKEAPSIKLIENLLNVMNSDFKRLSYTEGVEICVRVIPSFYIQFFRMKRKERLSLKTSWPGVLI